MISIIWLTMELASPSASLRPNTHLRLSPRADATMTHRGRPHQRDFRAGMRGNA